MYADDITVWTTRGSLGEKQERLQEAAPCVENYTKERGLRCSTEKSEFLRIGRHPTQATLEVTLEGQLIPEKNMIRILGMWLQGSRKCSHTISLLSKAAEQVGRMINRVSQKRYGMREEDTLKRELEQSRRESNELRRQLNELIREKHVGAATRQENGRTATLISNKVVAIVHDEIKDTQIEHVITEIIPKKKRKANSTFIVNLYSPPSQTKGDFIRHFAEAKKKAGQNALVIAGDFNAKSPKWGYPKEDKKGRGICTAAESVGCELLTDENQPTRQGNSASPDTCPDLSFVRGAKNAEWENLLENLGSDHYILRISLTAEQVRRKIGTARLTDWDAFRAHCKQLEGGTIESAENWSQQLRQIQDLYTKEVVRTEQTPEVDKRLLRLWEARRGLTKRWKRQELNRKLKKKIADITRQAEEYTNQLARQGWQQFSNSLNGTLSTARTWQILKALLDPSKNKSESSKAIQRLTHQYQGTDEQLLEEVQVKCYGKDQVESYKEEYRGEDNPTMDRPITREEVMEAVASATKNTAAGADKIRNSLIRNLNDEAIDQLAKYLNTLWQEGRVPAEWKHAVVVMIPKPGKKLQIENLRPISLTSCLEKLYEKIITRRIQNHLEKEQLYPDSMFGFRANLSTQDVLLQLKEEVLETMPKAGENVVMAIDIKGAFDNVSHVAIMEGLNNANCGKRTHDYVRDFLSNRTATVGLGELRRDVFHTPCKGKPQGSVISPVLFNVAMIGLANKLKKIEGIQHAMYADDITVWTTRGSLGEKQERLQVDREIGAPQNRQTSHPSNPGSHPRGSTHTRKEHDKNLGHVATRQPQMQSHH
ncbi:hypothetical protein V5799_013445 [Amblyomma americanum]|uniref:Reverse transcriptase domain-containing protein n=1 Tax=Amblyomma americanum TaxID=6943 RepID=A0AAQ4E5V7_AMBAM